MADVNEEIVKAYYEAQGYIVKTNHYYVKTTPAKEGKRKGYGASDIDLIIMHPKTNDKAIVSVKGWQNDTVRKSNLKSWEGNIKLIIDPQTVEAGKTFFGDYDFKKILVLSHIDKRDYNELKKKLEEDLKYNEVLDFPTILHELIEGNKMKKISPFNDHRDYRNSAFLQALRLFVKYYIKTK